MRKKIVLLSGGVTLLVSILFIALSVQGAGTQSPSLTAGVPAACTPTPAVRAPTFTIGPNERAIPGAANTVTRRYQATYPGDVHYPGKTSDLAPQVQQDDKYVLVVRHADCTYEDVFMTLDQIAAFKSNLPAGDTVVSGFEPRSQRGVHTQVTPPAGGTPSRLNGPASTVPPPPSRPSPALQTAVSRNARTALAGNKQSP
jgi:hypothetical protein